MSEWITDRKPTSEDANHRGDVWNEDGEYINWKYIAKGRPQMPTNRPQPRIEQYHWRPYFNPILRHWSVTTGRYTDSMHYLYKPEHAAAAERIADICNEVNT